MTPRLAGIRTLMFVPGDRTDMIAKVMRSAPDVVVVDLEDAVAAADKDAARQTAIEAVNALVAGRADDARGSSGPGDTRHPGGVSDAGWTVQPDGTVDTGDPSEPGGPAHGSGAPVLVRVNPPGSPWFAADVAAVAASRAAGVVLPKLERVEELTALRAQLPPGAIVVAGLETALGVADCRVLLGYRNGDRNADTSTADGRVPATSGADDRGVDAAYFGAEDYIADLGGRRTTSGDEVLYARSQVVLAARLAGVTAIDQAVVAVRDDDRFRADAAQGRDLGYQGKICLHPAQVAIAREVFSPSAEEIEHARAVVAAVAGGVGLVDGQMVDDVHLRMATALLARAGTPT